MSDFDPDAYLAASSPPKQSDSNDNSSFDPDAYLQSGPTVPEAADHGLSERQKLSPIGKALSPITSYPDTYNRMRHEAQDQTLQGFDQLTHPKDTWDIVKGVGNTALGSLGYVTSPVSAAYRSAVGQPMEDVTGIPREYTEFAAQLATPGIGLTSLKTPSKVPTSIPKPPPDPFGVTLTEGEKTGDLEAIRREQAAKRGTMGDAATKQATDFGEQREQQLDAAQNDVTKQLDPAANQIVAASPHDAADLAQSAIQKSAAQSKSIVDQAYTRAKNLGGELHPDALKDMSANIRDNLSNAAEPVIVDDGTPVAARMLKFIDDRVSKPYIRNDAELASPIPSTIAGVNLEGVDQLRKSLSTMRGDALKNFTNASDSRAANAIMRAFDEHINSAVNSPAFSGPPEAVDAWNAARAAHAERMKTYGNDAVGKKIKDIIGDPRAEKDPASLQAVSNYIYGATGKSPSDLNIAVAKRMQKILGQDSPEWAGIKQGYFQRLTENTAGMKDKGYGTIANNLAEGLDGKGKGLSEVLFSPAERDLLRSYGDLHRKMEVPATGANWSETSTFLSKAMNQIKDRISGVIGAVIAHAVVPGSHGVGEYAGSQISSKLSGMRERAVNAKQIKAQMPLIADKIAQWQQAVKTQQRISNAGNQGRLAIASTNVADAVSKLGIDHSQIMKMLAGPSGPSDSNAKDNPPQRAKGGKVNPIPESKETLLAQQKQLLDGSRDAQLYPSGKGELPLPKGLYRSKMPNGDVFHYHPKRMNVKRLKTASKAGKENEVLGLGPHSVIEAMSRAFKGEHPVAVVERDHKGIETRAAAGTHATAPAQLAALAKNKSAAHSLSVENPASTLALRRLNARAGGGRIKGYADGGSPTDDSDTPVDQPDISLAAQAPPKRVFIYPHKDEAPSDLPVAQDDQLPSDQGEKTKAATPLANELPELPDDRSDIVKYLSNIEFSKGSPTVNKIVDALTTDQPGQPRTQLWPERMVRSGFTLPHDVMTGKIPTEETDPDTGEVHSSMEMISRAQDMAGMAGSGGLGGISEGAGSASLGSSPFLRPALKYEGKIYKAPVGGEHADAMTPEIYQEYQKQALSGDDISNFNFGFMNHKGQFLNREDALQYGIDNGLVDPSSAKQGALTSDVPKPSTMLQSDSSAAGAPLAALEHAQPFYSAVEKTIQLAPQSKMHGEQWANWLKNQPGVKPDELQYTGIDNWLREQKGPVTKQQVADYIDQNQVKVNDVTKGAEHVDKAALDRRTDDYIYDWISDYHNDNGHSPSRDEIDEAREAYHDMIAENEGADGTATGMTKYSGYQLPGGSNYREHLLTLPDKNDPAYMQNINKTAKRLAKEGGDDWDQLLSEDQIDYLRLARLKHPEISDNYKSSHWDEPNILAHVRTNDREVGGKPALHLEEVQGDWGQQGRKYGFVGQPNPDAKNWVATKTPFGNWDVKTKTGNRIDSVDAPTPEAAIDKVAREYTSSTSTRVPDMPFKTSWPELAMKRMIHKVVSEGTDRISWTPGEAQAARYDLSKQLDSLEYNPDTGSLIGRKGGTVPLQKSGVKPEKLESMVGKDVAQKLMEQQPRGNSDLGWSVREMAGKDGYEIVNKNGDRPIFRGGNAFWSKPQAENALREAQETHKQLGGYRYLSGLDLKVGGEGMKGFYDQMLPKMVEKLGKQYGVKVKQHFPEDDATIRPGNGGYEVIRNGRAVSFGKDRQTAQDFIDKSKPAPIPYFDIPPKMKEDVLKNGFPLFSDTSVGGPLSALEHKLNSLPTLPAGDNYTGIKNLGLNVADDMRLRMPKYMNRELKNAPEQTFDPKDLLYAQNYLQKNKVVGFLKNPTVIDKAAQPITVLHQGDKYILTDGTHRAAAAYLLDKPITAKVVEARELNTNELRKLTPQQRGHYFDERKKQVPRPIQEGNTKPEINVPNRAAGGRVLAANVDPSPSLAQQKAGNYKKDHIHIHGLPITIENAKGGIRRGVDANGKNWECKLPESYGYIKQTNGADKDHLDVYVGPHIKSDKVFVINQIDHNTKQFDETKSMIGFRNIQHAMETYAKAFSDGKGLERIGSIIPTDMKQFKQWVKSNQHHKPFPTMKSAA